MKKKNLIKSLVCILVLSLGLVGCGNQSISNEESLDKKTLNMAIFWLDSNIEPTEGWNGWALTRCGIGENLVQIDENLNLKPVIASEYKKIDDLTYEFTIRENVKFSNGKTVTPQAIKDSLMRALEKTDRDDVIIDLNEIIADDKKITIKLNTPDNILLNKLSDTVFIIVDAEASNTEDFNVKPICTGAFKIDSFNPEKGMSLSKNEYHWSGNIDVDFVNVKYIQDSNTRAMALQSGEIDLATQIEATDVQIFEGNKDYDVLKGANLRVFLLRLNMEKPYMKLPEFRKALAYGMDKKVYSEKIANGIDANGPFNSMLAFGSDSDYPYAYNPQKAKELLDSVGIVDTDGDGIREYNGENINMKYYSRTNHGLSANNIGTAMQAQYKELGLGLEVIQIENYSDIAQKGEYDMLWERWTSAPSGDPQYFFDSSYKTGSAGNYGHYSNKEFDDICENLNKESDLNKRISLGKKGSELLVDDVATLFLYYQEGNVVKKKEISGVERFVSEIYYIDERVKVNN